MADDSSLDALMNLRPTDEPNVRLAVPFFGVKDIESSLRFYVDGLGFRMTKHWEPNGRICWCWLELGRVAVMLQEYRRDKGPGDSPAARPEQGVRICFMCGDAIAIYHKAKARGLEPATPFVGNGLWVTSFTDPDGYRLDFESPADAPEETMYAEPP
jgi:lactoylglutathione lyase